MKQIRHWIRRNTRRIWDKRARRHYERRETKAIPTQLGVCVTDACNIKCKYCMRETFKPPKGFFTLKKMKDLLRKMPYISGVCIMGLCEPLLNPETPGIIRWLKDEGGYPVSLTTNGMVDLTPNILDSLTRVDDMVISIDSANPATMKDQRGGADLDKIMKNLSRVLSYKRVRGLEVNDNPPIHINSVMTRKSFLEVPELIKMLEPYAEELTYLMVDPVSRPDYSTSDPLALDIELEKHLSEYRKIARASPLKVVGFDWMFEHSKRFDKCYLSWSAMFVEPNGDIYFCYDYENVLGNIFRENPLKVWNSPNAQEFRRKLLGVLGGGPPLDQCNFCNFAREGWQIDGAYNKKKEDLIE